MPAENVPIGKTTLPSFQFNEKAEADTSRRSQLILAEALGKPSLTVWMRTR